MDETSKLTSSLPCSKPSSRSSPQVAQRYLEVARKRFDMWHAHVLQRITWRRQDCKVQRCSRPCLVYALRFPLSLDFHWSPSFHGKAFHFASMVVQTRQNNLTFLATTVAVDFPQPNVCIEVNSLKTWQPCRSKGRSQFGLFLGQTVTSAGTRLAETALFGCALQWPYRP